MTIQVYEMGGYGVTASPNPTVYSNRAPVITDIISSAGNPYTVGQYWINQTTGNVYVYIGSGAWDQVGTPSGGPVDTLTGNTGGAVVPTAGNINVVGSITTEASGAGSTLTIGPSVTGYPITPFVVGPVGQAGYQTIQSAINAANAVGGACVYVQQGTYVENLTLYDQVNLIGVPGISQGINQGATINGTHTPPLSGHMIIDGIALVSTTNVFYSLAAGTAHLQVANVESAVENGYMYYLPNWTGILEIYDNNPATSGAPWAINDGGFYNTGGSPIIVYNSGAGSGTNVMTISGEAIFGQAVTIACPVNLLSGTNLVSIGSQFIGTFTCSGDSIVSSYSDSFIGGSNPSIVMSSSGACQFSNATIQSTHSPAITGSGAGELTLAGASFISNDAIANTLTLNTVNAYYPGNLVFAAAGNKILSTSVASTTTAGANAFGTVTLVSGTATIATSAVTASSMIFLTRQSPGSTGAAALGMLSVGTIVAGTHFIINALTTANSTTNVTSDVSVVGWMIVN